MPQISLYVDEETLKKVEAAAKSRHLSISKWVSEQIKFQLEPVYPSDFGNLFGSISPEDLQRPEQPSLNQDSPRVPL